VLTITIKALNFIKLCQKIVQDAKKNYWKLKDYDLAHVRNIMALSKKLKIAPVLIIREILKKRGYSRTEINKILRKEMDIPLDLKKKVDIACINDPVYSPLGLEYAKKRGIEGESIINSWLLSKGLSFKRDLGCGVSFPDFLLEKPIKIFEKSVIWIESKCYFGGVREMKENEKQFKKFDPLGDGVIIYWFGFEKEFNRYLLAGEKFKELLPKDLKSKVDELLNFIPPEFLHLLQ